MSGRWLHAEEAGNRLQTRPATKRGFVDKASSKTALLCNKRYTGKEWKHTPAHGECAVAPWKYTFIFMCAKKTPSTAHVFFMWKNIGMWICVSTVFFCVQTVLAWKGYCIFFMFTRLHGLLKSDMPPLVLTSSWWETSWKRGMGKRWGKFGGDRRSLWRKRRFLLHTYYIICKYKET